MRWCLVHDHDQVTAWMMLQHLTKEIDHLLGGNAFLVQPKYQLATTCNCRQRGHTPTLAGHRLLGRFATRCPCLAQQCGQRNVRFVLKVQNCRVFLHRRTYLWQVGLNPGLPLFGGQLKVFSFRLLVGQSGFVQPAHDGLLRYRDPKSVADNLNQAPCRPEIGLKPKLGCRRQHNRDQGVGSEILNLARSPRHGPAPKPLFSFRSKSRHPAMNRCSIRTIGASDFYDGKAFLQDRADCQSTQVQRGVPCVSERSFAHISGFSQTPASLSIPVLQNYWNGPYVGRISNTTGVCKDATTFGMSPPTSTDGLARYCLSQIWHGSTTAFEDDSMQLDKSNGFLRRHGYHPPIRRDLF